MHAANHNYTLILTLLCIKASFDFMKYICFVGNLTENIVSAYTKYDRMHILYSRQLARHIILVNSIKCSLYTQ